VSFQKNGGLLERFFSRCRESQHCRREIRREAGGTSKPFLALIVALVLGPYRRCSKDKFSPARCPATVAPCQRLQCAHWRRRKCSLQSRSEPHGKPPVGSTSAIIASSSGIERQSTRESTSGHASGMLRLLWWEER
jgi:hypothetical protein